MVSREAAPLNMVDSIVLIADPAFQPTRYSTVNTTHHVHIYLLSVQIEKPDKADGNSCMMAHIMQETW